MLYTENRLSTSLAHTQGAMAKAAPNRSGSKSRASEGGNCKLGIPKSHLQYDNFTHATIYIYIYPTITISYQIYTINIRIHKIPPISQMTSK